MMFQKTKGNFSMKKNNVATANKNKKRPIGVANKQKSNVVGVSVK